MPLTAKDAGVRQSRFTERYQTLLLQALERTKVERQGTVKEMSSQIETLMIEHIKGLEPMEEMQERQKEEKRRKSHRSVIWYNGKLIPGEVRITGVPDEIASYPADIGDIVVKRQLARIEARIEADLASDSSSESECMFPDVSDWVAEIYQKHNIDLPIPRWRTKWEDALQEQEDHTSSPLVTVNEDEQKPETDDGEDETFDVHTDWEHMLKSFCNIM